MNNPLQQVGEVWERMLTSSPIYAFLLSEIEVYHAEKGAIRARIQVSPQHVNSRGALHGAFSACVADWAGGLAIASHGLDSTGVSIDIHVNYISTATSDDWLEIEGRTEKVGGTLAFTTITISKVVSPGELALVARGSLTKYIKKTR